MKKGNSKYNWPELFNEFCHSEILEVATWIKERFGKNTGTFRSKTLGWTERKRQYLKLIAETARAKAAAEIGAQKGHDYAQLVLQVIDEIQRRLSDNRSKVWMTSSDLERYFSMLRTMDGKVSKITQQTQLPDPPKEEDYSKKAEELETNFINPDAQSSGANQNHQEGSVNSRNVSSMATSVAASSEERPAPLDQKNTEA